MERLTGSLTKLADLAQGRLFWDSNSFEEYAIACDMAGAECLFDQENFDSIHEIFNSILEKHGRVNSL